MYYKVSTKNYSSVLCYSKHTFVFVFLLLIAPLFQQGVEAQEITCVEYVETFQNGNVDGISLPIVSKSDRLKNNSAISFLIDYNENVPDSVVKCLEVASDIWRSCLKMNSNKKIELLLKWAELGDDEDVKIQVYYCKGNDGNHYPPPKVFSIA